MFTVDSSQYTDGLGANVEASGLKLLVNYISGHPFRPDHTFINTARLCCELFGYEGKVCLYSGHVTHANQNAAAHGMINALQAIGTPYNTLSAEEQRAKRLLYLDKYIGEEFKMNWAEGQIAVYTVSRHEIFDDVFDEFIANCAEKAGFTELKTEKLYAKQQGHNITCFTDERNKNALIILRGVSCSNTGWHFAQSMFTRFAPWVLNGTKPEDIPVELREYFVSLNQESGSVYVDAVERVITAHNLRDKIVNRVIETVMRGTVDASISNYESRIADHRRRLANLYSDIASVNTYLTRDLDALTGLRERNKDIEAKTSEFKDYISTCESSITIKANSSSKTSLDVYVKTYLKNFDVDLAETYIANDESYLYEWDNWSSDMLNLEDRRRLLKAVFLDESIKIRMAGQFTVDPTSCSFRYARDGEAESLRNHYLPNPHVAHFDCFGNNSRYINDALMNGDMITVVEMLRSVTENLNIADGTVGKTFVEAVLNSETAYRIYETNDGQLLTPSEAVEYLKAHEGE